MPRGNSPLFLFLALPALFLFSSAALADASVCDAYPNGVSSQETKARLLTETKNSLVPLSHPKNGSTMRLTAFAPSAMIPSVRCFAKNFLRFSSSACTA